MDRDINTLRLNSYRQLIAWQKAISLVADVYEATHDMPKSELYGLTSQLRRSAVSIPATSLRDKGELHGANSFSF